MKQVTLDNTKTPNEIANSVCFRRNNDPCTDACPFFEHIPDSYSGDIIVITCNTYQLLVEVAGYTG